MFHRFKARVGCKVKKEGWKEQGMRKTAAETPEESVRNVGQKARIPRKTFRGTCGKRTQCTAKTQGVRNEQAPVSPSRWSVDKPTRTLGVSIDVSQVWMMQFLGVKCCTGRVNS